MSSHVAATFTNKSDVSAGSGRKASAMVCNEHVEFGASFRDKIPHKGREAAETNP